LIKKAEGWPHRWHRPSCRQNSVIRCPRRPCRRPCRRPRRVAYRQSLGRRPHLPSPLAGEGGSQRLTDEGSHRRGRQEDDRLTPPSTSESSPVSPAPQSPPATGRAASEGSSRTRPWCRTPASRSAVSEVSACSSRIEGEKTVRISVTRHDEWGQIFPCPACRTQSKTAR